MYKKYVSCFALLGSLSLMSSSGMAGIAQEDYQKLTTSQKDMNTLIEALEHAITQDELKTFKDIGESKHDNTDEGLGITLFLLDGTVVAASGHPQIHPLINLSYLKDEEGNLFIDDILRDSSSGELVCKFVKGITIKGRKTNARIYAKQTKDKKFIIVVRKADSETIAPEKGAHEALKAQKK